MKRMVSYLLVAFVFGLAGAVTVLPFTNNQTDPEPVTQVETPVVTTKDVWEEVQAWRIKEGKPEYIYDQKLCYVASSRAVQIQDNFSHDGFSEGQKDRFTQFPEYRKWGENLAENYASSSDMLNAWLSSPTHRGNLEYSFTSSCVVCINNKCVQIFGQK